MTDVDFLEPQAEEQILATHIIVNTRATGETGVVNGNRITPTSPASMNITVAAGRIKISNTAIDVDEETKAMGASNATLGRMDIIIRNASGAVQVVAGSLAEVNDPKGLGNWHQYDSPAPAGNIPAGVILGAVFVAPQATAISEGDIWMFAGPVGEAAHTQGTDQGLDTGGPNAVTAAQARDAASKAHVQGTDAGVGTGGAYATTSVELKDAVTKKHAHSNSALLDTYGQTETDLADAVTKKHAQNSDTYLNQGGANQVTAADAASAVTLKHSHANKTGLDKLTSYRLEFCLYGTPAVLTASQTYPGIEVPIAGTITEIRCMSNDATSGSISVALKKGTYANAPATLSTIATAAISSSTKSEVTGQSIAVAAGDWIIPYINSVTSLKNVTVSLKVEI
jgi:hypothetical protein